MIFGRVGGRFFCGCTVGVEASSLTELMLLDFRGMDTLKGFYQKQRALKDEMHVVHMYNKNMVGKFKVCGFYDWWFA